MRGKFKGKKGKVTMIDIKGLKVLIEDVQRGKQDASKTSVPIKPSNLQIIELNLEDRKRLRSKSKKQGSEKKTESVSKPIEKKEVGLKTKIKKPTENKK
jgi:ribosomal protein L24